VDQGQLPLRRLGRGACIAKDVKLLDDRGQLRANLNLYRLSRMGLKGGSPPGIGRAGIANEGRERDCRFLDHRRREPLVGVAFRHDGILLVLPGLNCLASVWPWEQGERRVLPY